MSMKFFLHQNTQNGSICNSAARCICVHETVFFIFLFSFTSKYLAAIAFSSLQLVHLKITNILNINTAFLADGEEIDAFQHSLPLPSILTDAIKAPFNTINGKVRTEKYQFIDIYRNIYFFRHLYRHLYIRL